MLLFLATVERTPEQKRYKNYTREDIQAAIEAVKRGMSANRAAVRYRVPSRTLYDKIKKLRMAGVHFDKCTDSGQSDALLNFSSGGHYPTLDSPIDVDNANQMESNSMGDRSSPVDNPSSRRPSSSLMDSRIPDDDDDDDEETTTTTTTTTTPPTPPTTTTTTPLERADQEVRNGEAQDLTINRRSDVSVIMSPMITDKEDE